MMHWCVVLNVQADELSGDEEVSDYAAENDDDDNDDDDDDDDDDDANDADDDDDEDDDDVGSDYEVEGDFVDVTHLTTFDVVFGSDLKRQSLRLFLIAAILKERGSSH